MVEEWSKADRQIPLPGKVLGIFKKWSGNGVIFMSWVEAIRNFRTKSKRWTRHIVQQSPDITVVILTPGEDSNGFSQLVRDNARIYVNRHIDTITLNSIFRRVSGGENSLPGGVSVSSKAVQRVLGQLPDKSLMPLTVNSPAAPLTPRELEVLSYVARGNGNKRIATTLNVSEQTIKNHITSVLRKLGANDRTHAVVMAMCHGWISMSEQNEVATVP